MRQTVHLCVRARQIFRSDISMDLFIFQSHIHSFIYLFVICFGEMLMIQLEDSVS